MEFITLFLRKNIIPWKNLSYECKTEWTWNSNYLNSSVNLQNILKPLTFFTKNSEIWILHYSKIHFKRDKCIMNQKKIIFHLGSFIIWHFHGFVNKTKCLRLKNKRLILVVNLVCCCESIINDLLSSILALRIDLIASTFEY